MKTLKELAEEVGFPFEAEFKSKNGDIQKYWFHGWCKTGPEGVIVEPGDGSLTINREPHIKRWTLVTPKKKLVEYLCHEALDIWSNYWAESEDKAREWCTKNQCTFIKVLREEEI